MTDSPKVKALEGSCNLEEVKPGIGPFHLHLFYDLVEQLPTLRQLQHNEQEIRCVNHNLQVYDAQVVHRLEDPYLVQPAGGAQHKHLFV